MLTVLTGDAIEQLRTLPDECVQCCVTSPPYWGLRDYSVNGQLGLEKTPEEYVEKLVEVFREVRRVLRKDGTLWLNLGDSFASGGTGGCSDSSTLNGGKGVGPTEKIKQGVQIQRRALGLKPKDLCGIPWRVAFALQADGWWLRSDIIWAKPNPMPESVTDRPTKSHEYLFLLTKSASYFYDAEAIKEPVESKWEESHYKYYRDSGTAVALTNPDRLDQGEAGGRFAAGNRFSAGRNKRSVWTVATAPYPEAHFATYPPDLIKPCIMAGTSAKGCCAKSGAPWERVTQEHDSPIRLVKTNGPVGDHGFMGGNRRDIAKQIETLGWQPTCKCCYKLNDWTQRYAATPCTVLDPFAGSGTTGMVALELGRKAVLIELSPKYVELIEQRCNVTMGLALA
jgi:DNA modification methylase